MANGKSYLLAALFFLVVDTIFIRTFFIDAYIRELSSILNMKGQSLEGRVTPAVLFYVIYLGCFFFLVLERVTTVKEGFLYGAVYGLATYSTYCLTNHTIMSAWSWSITMTDIAWGTILTGSTGAVGSFLKAYFSKVIES